MTLNDPAQVWFGGDESPPKRGTWLVLNYHHDGESHWCDAAQIRARLRTIRGVKPEGERPARLRARGFIPYSQTTAALDARYRPERDSLDEKYRSECDALDEKYRPERDALDEKWRSERDALEEKYRSDWHALYAKWLSELAALPILTVEEWEGRE